ncbi:MAG: hypothetical protein HWD60_20155 [Defluviicoccus sp.]|nr:MAG: hypothetical protein HWD60_20155 [Defluviicoccus sp.]
MAGALDAPFASEYNAILGIYSFQDKEGFIMDTVGAPAGTPGDDTLVGDATSLDGEAIDLAVDAGNAEQTVDGADNEVVRAYLSTLSGAGGEDLISGDVYAREGGAMDLSVQVGAGAYFDGRYYDPPVGSGQEEAITTSLHSRTGCSVDWATMSSRETF